MGLKFHVSKDALSAISKSAPSNKHQTLPENTPTSAIPSPPTALHVHSAPIPFIDKISVIFEPLTEQDAHETHLRP
jgi:hypothetical protein